MDGDYATYASGSNRSDLIDAIVMEAARWSGLKNYITGNYSRIPKENITLSAGTRQLDAIFVIPL